MAPREGHGLELSAEEEIPMPVEDPDLSGVGEGRPRVPSLSRLEEERRSKYNGLRFDN